MSDDLFVKTCFIPEGVKCLCSDPECSGLTAAFAILDDVRRLFVKLPRFKPNPPSPYYVERNRQRESYLRYLLPEHPVEQETSSRFIALHHFHPQLISKQGIPKIVSAVQAITLLRVLNERDRVVDENGMLCFVCVPNYSKQEVQKDLIKLTAERKKEESNKSLVMKQQQQEQDSDDQDVLLLLKRLVKAATVCQCFIRRCQAKKALQQARQEKAAATLIQRYWLRALPTLLCHRMQRSDDEDRRMVALLVLQSSARQWMLAKNVQAQNDASTIIQAQWRRHMAYEDYLQKRVSVVAIQSVFRGLLVRHNIQDMNASTFTIQTAWRRYRDQCQYRMCLHDIVVVQSLCRQRAALAESDARMAALLVLQSRARQRLVAKNLQAQNEASTAIQATWRGHVLHNHYQQKRNSVVAVQSVHHGRFVRRNSIQDMNANALTIQTAWRRYRAHCQYRARLYDIIVVQSLCRQRAAVAESVARKSALVALQSIVRMHNAMQSTKRFRNVIVEQERRAASVHLQSVVRRHLASTQYKKWNEAIVQCQASARRHLAQKQLQAYCASSTINVQRVWRGFQARSDYTTTIDNVLIVQKLVRRNIALDTYKSQLAAIQCLQNALRRWIAVRETAAMRRHLGEISRKVCQTLEATCKIQAVARGFLCRKKMAWMMMFIRLKAFETQRRKVYEESFEGACNDWKSCVRVLDDGVRVIARAERLLQGASMADRALGEALRAISEDCFLDDSYDIIMDEKQRHSIQSTRERSIMPTDQVLKALLKAEGTRADRVDNAVGSGLSDAHSELSVFQQEFEMKVKQVKRVGNSLVKSMSTKGMISSEKAVQRAWDAFETAARRVWEVRLKSREESVVNETAALERLLEPTKDEVGTENTVYPSISADTSSEISLPKPTGNVDSNSERKLSSSQVAMQKKSFDATNEAPSTPSSPETKQVLASAPKTPEWLAEKASWMPEKCPPLTAVDSPQSVSTNGADSPRKHGIDSTRQLSGWYPFSSDSAVEDVESVITEAEPTSPSSRRKFFSNQWSEGRSYISGNLNSLLSEDGCRKCGFEFFQHMSSEHLPDFPTVQRSQLFGSSTVEDRWLCEWNYRAATLRLACVWDACLSLFAKMSEAVKAIERERIGTLADILVAAVSSERRVLLATRDVNEALIQELLEIRHDRAHISECMDELILQHCRILLQTDNDHGSSIVNRSRCLVPDFTEHMGEPLESGELHIIPHRAIILERSVGRRCWKTTLTVVTAELHMHLFDLSFIPEISIESSAGEAFAKLLPTDGFSADGSFVTREEKLLKDLTPVCNVNLRNCKISGGDKDSVEVTETYARRFRDGATRKFLLRGQAEDVEVLKDFLESASSDEP